MTSPLITVDPESLGATPVFRGTRVPIKTLFDHLKAGDSLNVFLEDFPSVRRELAIAVLEQARAALLSDAHPAPSSVTPQELALLDAASRSAEKAIEEMNAMLGTTNRRADQVFTKLERMRGAASAHAPAKRAPASKSKTTRRPR
jgi:uncharacterized protein (DUF433 family)